ncbi:hypothetical protein BOX15_Mlig014772g1 [Macrostomum lignano]|uniref:Uncharacterized protein n=2 Tax=Macrostomum lignano TaxID=282301 RepID=A0A267EZH4_9PLAT|nr:hypothetical protein BOX15_Mlig014772g1 [Macrostomum lignano]
MAFRRDFNERSDKRDKGASNQTTNLNRRLRNIWEREGKDYGEDIDDEDELVDRFEATKKMNEQSISRVMANIHRSKTVDFCFLIDATGSMQPHIDGARDSVKKVVNSLVQGQQSQSGILKLRFAVVAYRDLTDKIPYEMLDFCEQPEVCISFCRNLVASGGGDAPEDVFGGLDIATSRLQWSEDAGTRIIFHMADAPCHGKRFHNLSDSYPNGDPKGRTENALFAAMKRLHIDYYFGKINSSTDRMIELFSLAYGRPITEFSVDAIANIAGSVINSITTSIDCNVEKTKLGTPTVQARNFRLDPNIPNWDEQLVQKGSYLQFKLPESMEDVKNDVSLTEKKIENVRVKVADCPFAEGAERIAYYGVDLFQGYNTGEFAARGRGRGRRGGNGGSQRFPSAGYGQESSSPTEVVFKEYKQVGHKQNSLERYRAASEVQTIAFFLADKFNKKTAIVGETLQIKFLKIRTIILRPSKNVLRVMSCERRFIGGGDFVKFTNNCGYSLQLAAEKIAKFGIDPVILELVAAFSHWTYHFSKGFLMVVDLQGKICTDGTGGRGKILMTDPAIHCLDTTRYAPLNLGMPGMQAFFAAHECNRLCGRLGLPPARPVATA